MGFNIYNDDEKKKEYTTVLKENWATWKATNKTMKTIFFPINKEFETQHLKNISGGACKLYLFLGLKSRKTGESWYSISKMAHSLDVKPRTIDNWLQELEDRGLILRDRQGQTSTTYLLPYSLNIINMKMPVDYQKKEEIISTLIERAENDKDAVGQIHRIYHLFQWNSIKNLRTVQVLAVVTKKDFVKGPPMYTAYLCYEYVNKPPFVLEEKKITNTRKFPSWFSHDNIDVIGIGLESSENLITFNSQKDALTQLSNAPSDYIKNINGIKVITTDEFIDKYSIDDNYSDGDEEVDNNVENPNEEGE